jgi:hypothetical protein
MKMKKLPPLLYTTNEGRRVYELQGIINKRKVNKLVIDPHYEEEHGSYMNDEKICILVYELLRTQGFSFLLVGWKSENTLRLTSFGKKKITVWFFV